MATARDILDETVTSFEATTPVDDVIDEIRTSTAGSERTVYYAYVVDGDGTLEGVTSLRELLNAGGDTPIGEIATDSVVFVETDDSVDRVATVFSRQQFMALPVVDESKELVGAVTAGDVIEALDEEASKKVLKTTIRDIEYDPADESTYECFSCGTIMTATTNPGTCPNCGSDVRHRQTSIE
ncbi:rubrerythrin-like domain-containing protein [Natronolimnohabitans sp. A-GB9]|uniref:rubrerythrin-like domain-containing protein n=1 Tax=Natronolimnohabitans sp. A-GB9 TaxID=3069757 RepID=UPI0027B3FAB2|nr:rubrerythrin-like domain-containing protein [Natronolimnohabitans sp. A-GB9]MDQ2052003.1 rubrerythrin-like domain-containing protein [Natronolimnohabitans sp. A-GB9]